MVAKFLHNQFAVIGSIPDSFWLEGTNICSDFSVVQLILTYGGTESYPDHLKCIPKVLFLKACLLKCRGAQPLSLLQSLATCHGGKTSL